MDYMVFQVLQSGDIIYQEVYHERTIFGDIDDINAGNQNNYYFNFSRRVFLKAGDKVQVKLVHSNDKTIGDSNSAFNFVASNLGSYLQITKVPLE